MLFNWMVTGQVVSTNPVAAVLGPTHVVKTGKTPVVDGAEWRTLLESIPAMTLWDLLERALIATATYNFARINAALRMTVEDLRPRGAGWTIRLHDKGGRHHAMPSCARRNPTCLYQRFRNCRGPQGVAILDFPRSRRQYPLRSTKGIAGRLAKSRRASARSRRSYSQRSSCRQWSSTRRGT